MIEPVSMISLGLTSARVLAGVTCFGYSLLHKDISGAGADPFGKIQESIFGQAVGGIAYEWLGEAKGLAAKKFYDQISKIDKDNLNHDLQRAARKAQLIATLFACEASLQEIKAGHSLLKSLVWQNEDEKWLSAVRNWIKADLKDLPNTAPQTDIDYEEAFRIFDLKLSQSPDEQQKEFIAGTKQAVLDEIYKQDYKKWFSEVELSKSGYELLADKINNGWEDFKPDDDYLVQLKLSDRDLPEEKKDHDKWFWLVCSFFNEEYKTNERLKAAMLKNLHLEHKKALAGLSISVAKIGTDLTQIEAKQDEILELVKKIELEANREPFYAKYQGLESKREVDKIISAKVEEKVFVGREDEYQRLEDFISKEKSGYFVIKAKGGYGKTSLLARWISQRLHQNEINYGQRIFLIYHFFNQTLDPTRILNNAYTNILRQLCAYQAKEEFPGEPGRLRDTIIGLLNEQKAAESEPLVIVLDALDEAEAEVEPFGELPEGVFVIVSARADEKEEPRYLEKWLKAANFDVTRILFLDKLSKQGVEKLLRVKNFPLADDEEFIESLYQKTDGFPLYLDYLIDDLKDEPVEQIKAQLDEMPDEFGEYVETQYDSLCRYLSENLGNNWTNKVEMLFGILSVSLGSLSKYDVKKLTAITESEIRGLPSKIWRWIRIREEDGEKTFSFDHATLKDVFAGDIFSDEKSEFLETLLEYCAEWQDHKPSRYALQHYPEHLFREKKWETLYELAQDENFLKSQEQAFLREADIVLRTLQTALRAAIDWDNAPVMAEFMLRHAAQVQKNLNESPLDALEKNLERALSQAELIFSKDIERGALWFLLLAKVLSEQGMPEKARDILKQLNARNLLRSTDESIEGLAVIAFIELLKVDENLVILLVKRLLTDWERERLIFRLLGKLKTDIILSLERKIEVSLGLVEIIIDKNSRNEALSLIAQAQVDSGNFDEAVKTAEMITDDLRWTETLSSIAQTQANSGSSKEAIRTFGEVIRTDEEVTEEWQQAESLSSIAQANLVDSEETDKTFAEAVEAAEKITEAYNRFPALSSIAKAQASSGDIEEAIKTAKKISIDFFRAGTLSSIALAQSDSGNSEQANKIFAEAIKTSEKVSEECRASALISIAQASAGNSEEANNIFAEAVKTANKISNRLEQDEALISIARELEILGNFDEAVKTADKIFSKSSRVETLSFIAQAQASSGNSEEASKTFTEAIKTAETDEWRRASLLSSIAQAQANSGRLDEAVKTTEKIVKGLKSFYRKIDNRYEVIISEKIAEEWQQAESLSSIAQAQAKALSSIALAQAKVGNSEEANKIFAEAVKTAERISDLPNLVETLSLIAQTQANSGNSEEANRTFVKAIWTSKQIATSWLWVRALTSIAQAQANSGDFDEAIKTAEQISELREKALTLSSIAQVQAESGNAEETNKTFAEAVKTAEKITDNLKRTGALSLIAQALADSGNFDEALSLVNSILIYNFKQLPEFASAFASKGNKQGFKQLLIPTAYYLDAAYKMVGMLAKLYPEQSSEILEVLRKY